MNQGTVKFFNRVKRFGFITNDETGEDIFVHASGLNDGIIELQEGQKVSYDTEKDPKSNKDKAVNVTAL